MPIDSIGIFFELILQKIITLLKKKNDYDELLDTIWLDCSI